MLGDRIDHTHMARHELHLVGMRARVTGFKGEYDTSIEDSGLCSFRKYLPGPEKLGMED